MIPRHEQSGLLPVGEHAATWAEFMARFGGTKQRDLLLRSLRSLLVILADARCEQVLIGGSFVSTKPTPGDVDLAWDEVGVDFDALHPAFLAVSGMRALQDMFGVHAFPMVAVEGRTGFTFWEFFNRDQNAELTGAVLLDLTTL